jgi:hypothetical protein
MRSSWYWCWCVSASGASKQLAAYHAEFAAGGRFIHHHAGNIQEQRAAGGMFAGGSDRLQENSLFDIVQTIRQAKDDRNITGIVLDLKYWPWL